MVKKIVKPKVATLIISYNDHEDVERCLTSLKKTSTKTFEHVVILIDNSTDKDARTKIAHIARKYSTLVVFKPQEKNLGFASGMNKGYYLADKEQADYYFMLNIDTEIMPDTIEKLLASQQKSEAAIIAPLITFGDTKDIIYYAGGTTVWWLGIVRHPHRHQPVNPYDKKGRFVTFVNGCALLIPKTTISQYGNLFANYFMYYEETDLCARILHGGGTLYYEPKALVKHYTPHTDDKSANSIYYLTRNHWLFIKRNLAWWNKLTAVPAVICFQLYRLLKYTFKTDHRRAILQGMKDAIFNHYGQRI